MTHTLYDFDDIRPYADEEIPQAVSEVIADPKFRRVLARLFPLMPVWMSVRIITQALKKVKTPTDFQVRISRHVVKYVLRRSSTGHSYNFDALVNGRPRYTLITNHRDIVLDSAILCILLMDARFPATVEIAIGDNLLIHSWIRKLVRLNKSFIVRRNLPIREQLGASRHLSEYIHYVVNQKRDNVWVAQREGRAKDASDHTQESVLKMLAMGGEGTPVDALKALNIAPMTISYEYDPCDYLKARELQLKRDDPQWRKSREDDMLSMQTGILGAKGRIHYQASPSINRWLDELRSLPKPELFREVARRFDRDLHLAYRLYPGNYVADDLLTGVPSHAMNYTHKEKVAFEAYIQKQLDRIELPNKDEAFLRETILTMYANPLRNYEKAHAEND